MNTSIDTSTWTINTTSFSSLHDAWEQICTVSHAERGNLSTARRNKATVHLVCKTEGCPFQFYVSHDKRKSLYLLRRLNLSHTCIGSAGRERGTVHSALFMEAKVSNSIW